MGVTSVTVMHQAVRRRRSRFRLSRGLCDVLSGTPPPFARTSLGRPGPTASASRPGPGDRSGTNLSSIHY